MREFSMPNSFLPLHISPGMSVEGETGQKFGDAFRDASCDTLQILVATGFIPPDPNTNSLLLLKAIFNRLLLDFIESISIFQASRKFLKIAIALIGNSKVHWLVAWSERGRRNQWSKNKTISHARFTGDSH